MGSCVSELSPKARFPSGLIDSDPLCHVSTFFLGYSESEAPQSKGKVNPQPCCGWVAQGWPSWLASVPTHLLDGVAASRPVGPPTLLSSGPASN